MVSTVCMQSSRLNEDTYHERFVKLCEVLDSDNSVLLVPMRTFLARHVTNLRESCVDLSKYGCQDKL